MPDKNFRLTPGEEQKIKEWIAEHSGDGPECSVCGHKHWTLVDFLIHGKLYARGDMLIGGPSLPNVAIVCKKCSHTIYFNAVRIGLKPDSVEGEPEDVAPDNDSEVAEVTPEQEDGDSD